MGSTDCSSKAKAAARLTDALRKLSGIEHAKRFVCNWPMLSAVNPGLTVNGELIGIPVSHAIAASLSDPASGAKTYSDVRFLGHGWNTFVADAAQKAAETLGVSQKVSVSGAPVLTVHSNGAHVEHTYSHPRDKGDKAFAKMLIILPCAFQGPQLIVTHGSRQLCDLGAFDQVVGCHVVAFYTGCAHSVSPVTSGYRVELEYDLLVLQGRVPQPPRSLTTSPSVARVEKELRDLYVKQRLPWKFVYPLDMCGSHRTLPEAVKMLAELHSSVFRCSIEQVQVKRAGCVDADGGDIDWYSVETTNALSGLTLELEEEDLLGDVEFEDLGEPDEDDCGQEVYHYFEGPGIVIYPADDELAMEMLFQNTAPAGIHTLLQRILDIVAGGGGCSDQGNQEGQGSSLLWRLAMRGRPDVVAARMAVAAAKEVFSEEVTEQPASHQDDEFAALVRWLDFLGTLATRMDSRCAGCDDVAQIMLQGTTLEGMSKVNRVLTALQAKGWQFDSPTPFHAPFSRVAQSAMEHCTAVLARPLPSKWQDEDAAQKYQDGRKCSAQCAWCPDIVAFFSDANTQVLRYSKSEQGCQHVLSTLLRFRSSRLGTAGRPGLPSDVLRCSWYMDAPGAGGAPCILALTKQCNSINNKDQSAKGAQFFAECMSANNCECSKVAQFFRDEEANELHIQANFAVRTHIVRKFDKKASVTADGVSEEYGCSWKTVDAKSLLPPPALVIEKSTDHQKEHEAQRIMAEQILGNLRKLLSQPLPKKRRVD